MLFRTIFVILCLLSFINNAFALKLNLNLKDAIDKVTDEIENKLNDEDNIVNLESETQPTDKNLIIEIDEDISKVKIQDLKKLKTRDMEKVLFGTVSLGFYENGDTFTDIHYPNSPNEEGEYHAVINETDNFKGIYKIVQSKICYLQDGYDDWQCAWLYKSKKQKNIYYWALKGKVFAKIVNILDISEYKIAKSKIKNTKKENQEIQSKNEEQLVEKNNQEVNEEVEIEEVNLIDQLKLGYKFYNGNEVEVNYRKAVKYWEIAAQQGLAQAQLELGISYMLGEGVNKDLSLAYMWISNSLMEFYVINGTIQKNSHRKKEYFLPNNLHQEAKEYLQNLYSSMQSSDLIKGTSLANQCWKNKFKNCESNHLNYSVETEKKVIASGLPLCPEDDPNKLYQLKWDQCFGIKDFGDETYEGEWNNGFIDGKGTYTWNNGNKYVGEFVENRIEGLGVFYYINGDIYEGLFKNSTFDGIGKLTYANGEVEEGIWKDGNLIENKKVNNLVNVENEYVAIKNANILEEPFEDSKLLTTIEKGTTVLVLKKTKDEKWFLIKEIKENWGNEDIGQLLGYSSSKLYKSQDSVFKSVSKKEDSNLSEYSAPPGKLLLDAYTYYIIIKKMHEVRDGYAMVYITDIQFSNARTQVKEIEDTLLSKYELDEDLIWNMSNKEYKKAFGVVDLYSATGAYTDEGERFAKLVLLNLDSIAKELLDEDISKDF